MKGSPSYGKHETTNKGERPNPNSIAEIVPKQCFGCKQLSAWGGGLRCLELSFSEFFPDISLVLNTSKLSKFQWSSRGTGRNTVSRPPVRKRELTELCKKLGEFALAHKAEERTH